MKDLCAWVWAGVGAFIIVCGLWPDVAGEKIAIAVKAYNVEMMK